MCGPMTAPRASPTPRPAKGHEKSPGVDGGGLGLGLDAGGTHTRWALADSAGRVVAEGELPPMSGQQLASDEGRLALAATLQQLAQALAAHHLRQAGASHHLPPAGASHPRVHALVAGITGFDAQAMPQWQTLAAQALQLPTAAVRAISDIELACAAAFAPGHGVVLIAGTGSIAAHVDAQGQLHRAGGRGAVIDDAGGGHWIARQALQHIWRAEDGAPGSWQASALARRVFDHLGGSSWAQTRAWVYGATRGELGTLARTVAQAADDDDAAAAILRQAGQELARLVLALQQRLGAQPLAHPLALTGRVFELHPLIETSLLQALPAPQSVQRLQTPAHHAAARLAATTPPQWAASDLRDAP